jgi:hypothetical protein
LNASPSWRGANVSALLAANNNRPRGASLPARPFSFAGQARPFTLGQLWALIDQDAPLPLGWT